MVLLEQNSNENARSYALRVLQYNIVNLYFTPGCSVSENELSAQLALSRTPIREALIELSKIGLVEILPQRGSYVTKINYAAIEEGSFIRYAVETAILKSICTEGLSPHFSKLLQKSLDDQRDCAENQQDPYKFLKLDNEFHKLLYYAADKERILQMLSTQMIHLERLKLIALDSLKTVKSEQTLRDHENIFYALTQRDPELCDMVLSKHIFRFREEKEDVIALRPEYFRSSETDTIPASTQVLF